LGIPDLEYGPLDTQLRKTFLNFQQSAPGDLLKVLTKEPTGPSIILMQGEARDPMSETGALKKYVFGGYANEAWRPNQGYFGTANSFLFSFTKDQAAKLRLRSGDSKALFASNTKISFGEKDLVLQEDVVCMSNIGSVDYRC
jgi:TLD